MKFVFDECVSYRILLALQALGKDAAAYFEHWQRGALDLDWIPKACSRGWCIVTSDRFKRPHERAALKQHNARVILLRTKNLTFWHQVRLVINRWDKIEAIARRHRPPYIFRFSSRKKEPDKLVI